MNTLIDSTIVFDEQRNKANALMSRLLTLDANNTDAQQFLFTAIEQRNVFLINRCIIELKKRLSWAKISRLQNNS